MWGGAGPEGETWPLEGAPAAGHWVRSPVPRVCAAATRLTKTRAAGRPGIVSGPHTQSSEAGGQLQGYSCPSPQFPLHRIGLTSSFQGMCGDPLEVTDRRGCCKLERGKVQHCWVLGAGTDPWKALEVGLTAISEYEGHNSTRQDWKVPEACHSPQGNIGKLGP